MALCTLAGRTALPQPGSQQDLDTRDVKGWQEKMLLFSWARPSPHLQLISVFHFFQVLSRCEMSHSPQSVPIGKLWALLWHPQLQIPSNPLLDCTLCPYISILMSLTNQGQRQGCGEACSRTMHISSPCCPQGCHSPSQPCCGGGHNGREVAETSLSPDPAPSCTAGRNARP